MVIVNIQVYKHAYFIRVHVTHMYIYLLYIYTYLIMYVCICKYIRVQNIKYICIYVYLIRVDLNILLLVSSDRYDITKSWKGLLENPGAFQFMSMFASHAFLPASSAIPLTLGRNVELTFLGKKKLLIRNKGS